MDMEGNESMFMTFRNKSLIEVRSETSSKYLVQKVKLSIGTDRVISK